MINKAWNTAISPATGFFMYFIMFYFFGSSVNIYTLIMFFSVAINHIKNITSVREKFKIYEPYKLKEVSFYKMIFIAVNLGILGFIAYKFNTMGLLPLSPSDYLDILPLH